MMEKLYGDKKKTIFLQALISLVLIILLVPTIQAYENSEVERVGISLIAFRNATTEYGITNQPTNATNITHIGWFLNFSLPIKLPATGGGTDNSIINITNITIPLESLLPFLSCKEGYSIASDNNNFICLKNFRLTLIQVIIIVMEFLAMSSLILFYFYKKKKDLNNSNNY